MTEVVARNALTLVSWNLAHGDAPWRELAASGADVALVQEAAAPPAGVSVEVDGEPWVTAGAGMTRNWRTAIVRVSDRVRVSWRRPKAVADARSDDLHVSRPGTLAVADVEVLATGESLTVVSMYSSWETPVKETGSQWIYADASAHRLISDISGLIGQQRGHRIIAAGDLNILYGYGEEGSPYWARRYASVFERMAAIGLDFVGPQLPNGLQANPWPAELPPASKNVPTYRTRRGDPASATRQLDFVFASGELRDRVSVAALNSVEQWGSSDHCRVLIDLAATS